MYSNILVAVDVDEPSESAEALATASTLANCFSAKLTICSVVRNANALAEGDWMPISYEQLLRVRRSKLDALAHSMGKAAAPEVEVGTGTICSGILEIAERTSADLIILASHRPGALDHVHQANAARVARRALCSVLIVRASAPATARMTTQLQKGTQRDELKHRSRSPIRL